MIFLVPVPFCGPDDAGFRDDDLPPPSNDVAGLEVLARADVPPSNSDSPNPPVLLSFKFSYSFKNVDFAPIFT